VPVIPGPADISQPAHPLDPKIAPQPCLRPDHGVDPVPPDPPFSRRRPAKCCKAARKKSSSNTCCATLRSSAASDVEPDGPSADKPAEPEGHEPALADSPGSRSASAPPCRKTRFHLYKRPRSIPSSDANAATSDAPSNRAIAASLNSRVCRRRLATPTSLVSVP